MKARLKTTHRAQFQRHEIEEERAIRLGRKADELPLGLRGSRIKDILEIGRFAAQSRPVVNDLAIDLARSVVNERHGNLVISDG
jgi:hypothetical protein